jgi:HlyD family secretion protein
MSSTLPANPSRQLFRARALQNAASTEALDVLPLLPRPVDQAGFVLLAILLAVGIGWSYFGMVARTVSGSGILIAQGGQLVEAQSTGAGRITDLAVRPGMAVEAGSLIASVVAADREQRLASAQSLADARRANLQRVRDITESVSQQRTAAEQLQRSAQEDRVRVFEDRIRTTAEQYDIQQGLLRRGLATLAKVNEARDAMNGARGDAAQALTALADIQAKAAEEARVDADRISQAREDLAAAERALAETEVETSTTARVIAPVSGRVVEIKANVGSVMSAGQAIVSIETGRTGLELLAFIPSRSAREVHPGMIVRVSPVGTRKEEQGELLGTVTEISAFPVSAVGLRALLQNETLADSLSRQGSPNVARITLMERPGGGYKWTSARGDDVALSSGALSGLEVVVSLHRPINLVVPTVRRFLGF